jgi:hypothetical protein
MKTTIKKSLQGLLVLVLAATFIGLGIWQLQRAQELQEYADLPIDSTIYPLLEKTAATGIVPGDSIGKIVTTSGYYIATYKAPNQKDGNGVVDDWAVSYTHLTLPTKLL